MVAAIFTLGALARGWQDFDATGLGSSHDQASARSGLSADYRELTNDRSEVANFNVETRRGLVIHPADAALWAINTHASTLNRYVLHQSQPVERYPTAMNPVSIAIHDDDLLVVGAGTRALLRHDRITGAVTGLCELPSEPFDIVVDHDIDRAFVACMGQGVVAEIDLVAMRVVTEHTIPGRRAAFLYFDAGAPFDPEDNRVFVTPNLSGNNSLVVGPPAVIQDGEDSELFPAGGLPDIDLVSIDTATGAQQAWGRAQGTLLFGHGRNPVTGHYWLLNIESINKDPDRQSEPDLKGVFAENRISITDFESAPTLPAPPDRVVSLDVELTGSPTDLLPVTMPTHVEFDPTNGGAWVVSPTSDAVAFLNAAGVRQPALDFELPAGSIPRQLVIDVSGAFGFVYAWGTNEIHAISLVPTDSGTVLASFDLGEDPLPEFLRAGREIFYDAHNSLNARTTCAHCHVGGGSDALGWAIADSPVDEKGVMVTQSLSGIADTFPHHWRGERDLVDFNGAFAGLLGGSELDTTPDGSLDQFVAFVQSLTSQPNPIQHVTRRLVDEQTSAPIEDGTPGSATLGQIVFSDVPSGGANVSCASCHALPTGSIGDAVGTNNATAIPAQVHFEAASFDNLVSFKDQPVVSVLTATGTRELAELGFGWGHAGLFASTFQFVNQGFPGLSDQEQRDVSTFLRQFDAGLSPAAQAAFRIDGSDPAALQVAAQRVEAILFEQADLQWVDVIAFGTDSLTGSPLLRSWLWSPDQEVFISEDPSVADVAWPTFVAAAEEGQCDLLVMGVPPGNGRRLGIDRDGDGLRNGVEQDIGSNPFVADTDGDRFSDGYEELHESDPLSDLETPSESVPPTITSIELDFANSRLAKFHWSADEPCSVEIAYSTPNGQSYVWRSPFLATQRTTVLTFDESSVLVPNTFVATATLTDASGNSATVPFATFDAGTMIAPIPHTLQVRSLELVQLTQPAAGALDVVAEIVVNIKESTLPLPPADGVVVIAQVLVWNEASERFEIAQSMTTDLPTSFVLDPAGEAVFDGLPGPFLVLPPTNPAGRSSASFALTGLTPGQRVKFNVIGIEAAGPGYDPAQPVFLETQLDKYQLPTTQPENRCIEHTY